MATVEVGAWVRTGRSNSVGHVVQRVLHHSIYTTLLIGFQAKCDREVRQGWGFYRVKDNEPICKKCFKRVQDDVQG
jgi:hypothetical protein